MFDDKNLLITGGTGSFGKKFVATVLKKYKPKKLIVFSRDEMKQWEMEKLYKNDSRVKMNHNFSFIQNMRSSNAANPSLNVNFTS